MPFKSLDSFNIEEPCVKRWAEDLNPSTARTYVFYVMKYVEWVKGKGLWKSAQEMLDDYAKLEPKAQFKHVDVLKEYVKSKGTGTNDKKNTLFAVRNFYEYHRLALPRLSRNENARILKLSETDKRRAMELAPLKIEEVRELILNTQQPYRAALMVMFQGAMGLAEFFQFNQKVWRKIADKLKDDGPIRVDLYRSKTSRQSVRKYYTFISEDAKTLIRQWMEIRPRAQATDDLFVTFNKNTKTWVPINANLIGNAITKTAKRTGLVKGDRVGRYHVHAHELRDLFKSLCTLSGVNQVASEFFLGHTVDKLGYDKSPEYDEEWFRNEYRKVEPLLNVISNPKGFKAEEDLNVAFKKQLLLVAGYSKEEVEAMNISSMSDEEIRTEVRKKLLGMMENNGMRQKVVLADEVENYIAQGWEYAGSLPNGKAILKLPF
jgi:hypothetical protein